MSKLIIIVSILLTKEKDSSVTLVKFEISKTPIEIILDDPTLRKERDKQLQIRPLMISVKITEFQEKLNEHHHEKLRNFEK
jgi:hypothetical protein